MVNALRDGASANDANNDADVAPTVGFAIERFVALKTELVVVDMSGQRKYADTLWECYYEDADAVVFVVDAAESDAAVEEARVALTEALVRAPKASSKEGKKTKKKPPLAVFANKSDVPAARTASELASAMRLTGESDALAGRAWHVGACCARTGEGVREGIRWVLEKT